MDLTPYRYVDSFHSWPTVLAFLLWLSATLFAVAFPVAKVALDPSFRLRDWLTAPLVAKWQSLSFVPRWALLVIGGPSLLVVAAAAMLVLDELLTLPRGAWLSLLPILLATLTGIALAMPQPSRGLVQACLGAVVLTVMGSVLFAGQFSSPASARTTPPAPGPQAASPEASPEPSTEPGDAESTPALPRPPARPADPQRLHLPSGEYGTTDICLKNYGDDAVAVTVYGPTSITALTTVTVEDVAVADVADLYPCAGKQHPNDRLLWRPGAVMDLIGGGTYRLASGPVSVIAYVGPDDAPRSQILVFRKEQDGLKLGLIPASAPR